MTFDTLDYIYLLIAVAWLAALVSGFIAVLCHRSFLRRLPAEQLNSTAGLWLLHPAMALASLVLAALFACALAFVWLKCTHDFFALVRLGYYQVAGVPPILGLYLLAQRWRRAPFLGMRPPMVLGILLLAPAPICAYASFVAPYRLVVERTDVPMPRMKADAPPIRIAVIADLQTAKITEYEQAAIGTALAEKPDLILMPGDFFQCSWRQWDKGKSSFVTEMQHLKCGNGTFGVLGDVDDELDLGQLLADTPVKLLLDEVVNVDVRGVKVAIGGLRLEHDEETVRRLINRLESQSVDVRILMAHRPDVLLMIEDAPNLDLIVAGHTHGGQIVIPGFGPPVTLTRVPRAVAAGGLHEVNGHRIYVSRGVGCERGSAPPVRFFCPPELSILTLTGRAK